MVISAQIHQKLQFSHATLSQLRRLEHRLLLLPSIFDSMTRTLYKLEAFASTCSAYGNTPLQTDCATKEVLENYKTMFNEYNQNASFVLSKVRGSAQLLLDTLNLKHQLIAQKTSENTLALNDSASIRVITVVTLVYLPATFTAVRT